VASTTLLSLACVALGSEAFVEPACRLEDSGCAAFDGAVVFERCGGFFV